MSLKLFRRYKVVLFREFVDDFTLLDCSYTGLVLDDFTIIGLCL